MVSNINNQGSIVASGTNNTTVITLPNGTQSVDVRISALYAVAAATSGLQASFQVSKDGSTFSTSQAATLVAAPAATVIGTAETVIRVDNSPLKLDTMVGIVAIKVLLTNLDATNAVNFTVSSEVSTVNP